LKGFGFNSWIRRNCARLNPDTSLPPQIVTILAFLLPTLYILSAWEFPTSGGDMGNYISIKVDEKGRLSIPAKIRQKLGINPGDTLFFRTDGQILQYAKLEEDPFETLAKEAVEKNKVGKALLLDDSEKKRKTGKIRKIPSARGPKMG